MQLKSRNSSLVPRPKRLMAQELGCLVKLRCCLGCTLQSLERLIPAVPLALVSAEPARCQLLRRAALELRGLCRRGRPTRLEASGGFRNGLVGRFGFTDLVFLLDSSKMAQLARCCSERRSCVGDKQRLQLSPPRGRRPSFQQPLLRQAGSPWHSSRCCCVP